MSLLARRGFTLVELLVAIALLGVVSTAVYRALSGARRVHQTQAQQIDLRQSVRAAATILSAELRGLAASEGDILAMAADSIRIRAMRQLAFLCAAPPLPSLAGSVALTIRHEPFFGLRDFRIGLDSILVYYEGDPAVRDDDGWVVGRPTGIQSSVTCADERPGRRLTTTLAFAPRPPGASCCPQLDGLGHIRTGAPVRGFEVVTYLRYVGSDGVPAIGVRQGPDLQPLIAPIMADGFRLTYRDSTGGVTALRTHVALIEVVIVGRSTEPVRWGDGTLRPAEDTVRTTVALRNNRRW